MSKPRPWYTVESGKRAWEDHYRSRLRCDRIIRTTHALPCGGGCEIEVGVRDGRVVWERPVADGTISRSCAEAPAAIAYLDPRQRVLRPLVRERLWAAWNQARATAPDPVSAWKRIRRSGAEWTTGRGNGGFTAIGWEGAVELAAAAVIATLETDGSGAVSGGCASPGRALVSAAAGLRFLALLGSPALDLAPAESAAMAAIRSVLGQDYRPPRAEDWARANLVVILRDDPVTSAAPDFQRILEARRAGAVVWLIDEAPSLTRRFADHVVPLPPALDLAWWQAVRGPGPAEDPGARERFLAEAGVPAEVVRRFLEQWRGVVQAGGSCLVLAGRAALRSPSAPEALREAARALVESGLADLPGSGLVWNSGQEETPPESGWESLANARDWIVGPPRGRRTGEEVLGDGRSPQVPRVSLRWLDDGDEGVPPSPQTDLAIQATFRMDFPALHADLVLPTPTGYEKDDLNYSSRTRKVIAQNRAVNPLGESRTEWNLFRDLAAACARMPGAGLETTESGNPRAELEDRFARLGTRASAGIGEDERVLDTERAVCRLLLTGRMQASGAGEEQPPVAARPTSAPDPSPRNADPGAWVTVGDPGCGVQLRLLRPHPRHRYGSLLTDVPNLRRLAGVDSVAWVHPDVLSAGSWAEGTRVRIGLGHGTTTALVASTREIPPGTCLLDLVPAPVDPATTPPAELQVIDGDPAAPGSRAQAPSGESGGGD